MKISKESEKLAKFWKDAGFVGTVFVDKNGHPIYSHAWCKELIITKIFEGKNVHGKNK